MRECCEVRQIDADQRRVLRVVLAINAAMFLVEFVAGILAHSTALLSDSADMLGDAIVYGFSLYAVGRGQAWQARAGLLKGTLMALFAAGVLVEACSKLLSGVTPDGGTMSAVAVIALLANASVLAALWRHRADDLNMRSVWLCSRNDVLANVGVLLAAAAVSLSGAAWPDIIVGLGIAALFGASALDVLRAAARVGTVRSSI